VFESFPFGLVLADRHGRLLKTNPRAASLLEKSAASRRHPERGSPATCCDVLCDQAPTEVVGASCFTDFALRGSMPGPEIRVDLGTSDRPVAAWVAAFTIGHTEPLVLFQLRPGAPFDRRRLATVDLSGFPAIRVSALGSFKVDAPRGSLDGAWLGQRPGTLLKYLVTERARAVSTDEVAEYVAGSELRDPLACVRQYVRQLRTCLEPDRPSRAPSLYVVTRKGGYALEGIWIDVDEFEHRLQMGLHALARGREMSARNWLDQARKLYRGDFLADDADLEWARRERDRLRELAAQMLRAMIELELRRADLAAAAIHARDLAEMAPLDADAQREFLRICLQMGRRAEAERGHDLFRDRHRHHFGEEPRLTLGELLPEAR
jgi:DNA-binding SARP family transcriptional activator